METSAAMCRSEPGTPLGRPSAIQIPAQIYGGAELIHRCFPLFSPTPVFETVLPPRGCLGHWAPLSLSQAALVAMACASWVELVAA